MINGNNFDALTHNGITHLFSETFQQQQFILQVIQISTLEEDVFTIFLSDGFTWIKGQLINQAKTEAIRCNLSTFSVIKFRAQNIQIMANNTFKLKEFTIVNHSMQNLIGQPVPFKDFNKKKEFINFESGNMISTKKYYTLNEVKQMPAGKLSLSILAKVVRKPDKINTVMNIMIQDEQSEQMQCCFFGDSVTKFRDLLQCGEWYYFTDPTLQVNNRFGNMLQLKINNSSNVVKQKKNSQMKPGIINHNNYTPKHKQEEQKKMKNDSILLKQFDVKDYIGKGNVQEYDKFIIARPLKVYEMKNSLGRRFECVDMFGQNIEILLWNQCKCEVKVNETYLFNYMKVKKYNDKISLQSQRGKTQVKPSTKKIVSRAQLCEGKVQNERSSYQETDQKFKKRYLGTNNIVYSIGQMMEKCQKSSEKSIIVISCGYLTIKFDFMPSNNHENISELRKRLFYVHCEKCESNQYLRSMLDVENMNGKVVCNGCKSQTFRMLWNIKAVFIDAQSELPVKINNEIVEKLIQMKPSQGMLLFLENYEALKQLILKRLNFRRGVFKFSSKLDSRQEGGRFYNICQYYEDGSKVFAQRAINQLKRTLQVFTQFQGRLNPESNNCESMIIEDDHEPKRRYDQRQDQGYENYQKMQIQR